MDIGLDHVFTLLGRRGDKLTKIKGGVADRIIALGVAPGRVPSRDPPLTKITRRHGEWWDAFASLALDVSIESWRCVP
jgi:hypothetical protein